jgi:anaerobic ribonucleoside-triphosphate reductase activating protein
LIAREDDVTKEALENIDVLIDGPFVDSCKAPNLKFRGSTNQRIIDLKNTLQNNSVIELAV